MTLCHSALVSLRASCESLARGSRVVESALLVFLFKGNSQPTLASSFTLLAYSSAIASLPLGFACFLVASSQTLATA